MKKYFILIEESYIALGPFQLWDFEVPHSFKEKGRENIFGRGS